MVPPLQGPAFSDIRKARESPYLPTQVLPDATDADKGKRPLPLAEAAGLPERQFCIPPSVYGGAAMCGILRECRTFDEWAQFCGEAWVRLLLSHIVQGFLIIGLLQLTLWQFDGLDEGTDCYRVQAWLFIICHWIFFIHVMTELIAAVDMTECVLMKIPTVKGNSRILLYSKDEDGELVLASGGMSKGRKVFVFLAVLLPRFVIAVMLLIIGGAFLASATSNTDLFMNSLAAAFVVEIDEMVFEFLTPAASKRLIEEIPPFGTTGDSAVWRALHRYWASSKLAVSAILVFICYFGDSLFGYPTGLTCPVDPCDGVSGNYICPVIPG